MKVAVIGGGPAGMMAAAAAAQNGHSVLLFERNSKMGRKLYISGKGRCNLTNTAPKDEFFAHIPQNPKFLYSAWNCFDNTDIRALMEKYGVPTKEERGGRVFPQSDHAVDVLRALEQHLWDSGARIRLEDRVERLLIEDGRITGIAAGGEEMPFDAVVVATGGVSYPATGSTGDGYRFAEQAGHTVKTPKPSLIGLETVETWPGTLAGLTLRNVTLRAYRGKKCVYESLGELLFTHTGVSGPLVLSASARLADKPEDALLQIDLKPGLDREMLDRRVLRDLDEFSKKQMRNALSALLPNSLIPIVLSYADIDADAVAGQLSREKRQALVQTLKCLPLTVKKANPIEEAIVTRGGVSTKEVNPSTMESKLVKNLYFAGEVLDVDGFTGGFNLQIAFSTGMLAGSSIADEF